MNITILEMKPGVFFYWWFEEIHPTWYRTVHHLLDSSLLKNSIWTFKFVDLYFIEYYYFKIWILMSAIAQSLSVSCLVIELQYVSMSLPRCIGIYLMLILPLLSIEWNVTRIKYIQSWIHKLRYNRISEWISRKHIFFYSRKDYDKNIIPKPIAHNHKSQQSKRAIISFPTIHTNFNQHGNTDQV